MVTISAHHVSLTSSITAVLLTLKKQHGGSTRTERLLNGAGVYKKKTPVWFSTSLHWEISCFLSFYVACSLLPFDLSTLTASS